jgi:hypothetical protein
MRIVFRQTGGYAGLVLGSELDSSDLDASEAAALYALLRQDVGRPPTGPPSPACDLEIYQIRVQEDAQEDKKDRSFTFDQLSVPEAVIPLLERLMQEARPQPLT